MLNYHCSERVRCLFQEFYDSVSYYSADEFRDGIHFTKEKSSLKDLREYIKDLQNNCRELMDLKLE